MTLAAAHDALARHEWQRCHDLANAAELDDPRSEAERLALVGEALWWLGEVDASIDARQRAYAQFEALGDLRRAAHVAVHIYEGHNMRARPAMASGWLGRARRCVGEDSDCVEHGGLLLREAEIAHGGGQLADAEALARRALELGRVQRAADLEAEALQTLGRVLIDAGAARQGMAHLDEAMLFAVEGRLGPFSTGKVYCSLIGACEDLGDYRRAAEWTDATSAWAAQHPFAIFPGICRVHRAVVLTMRGDLVGAETEAVQASAELVGSHLANAAAALFEVGDIRRRLGDLSRAEEAFAEAEQLVGRSSPSAALLRLAQGRVDDAVRIVDAFMADPSPNRLGRARVLPVAAQVAVAAGDLDRAAAVITDLEAIAADYDTTMLHAFATAARGRYALARGDAVGACTSLHRSLALWQELEVPYEVASVRTLLGQALRDAGDPTGARAQFELARAAFDLIGVRLAAGQIGDVTERRLPAGLTEREAEVLLLVAEGLANKEIAGRLHLSAKTVSRHLSNIFTKIDVNSRAAATAFAFEHNIAGRV